jgi:hypothetical protein
MPSSAVWEPQLPMPAPTCPASAVNAMQPVTCLQLGRPRLIHCCAVAATYCCLQPRCCYNTSHMGRQLRGSAAAHPAVARSDGPPQHDHL